MHFCCAAPPQAQPTPCCELGTPPPAPGAKPLRPGRKSPRRRPKRPAPATKPAPRIWAGASLETRATPARGWAPGPSPRAPDGFHLASGLPPDVPSHLDDARELGRLLGNGERVAALTAGEAALRAERELLQRTEFRSGLDAALELILGFQRAGLAGHQSQHD